MAYSKAKLESYGDTASPCFKPFLNRKYVRQMSAYPDFLIGFI